MVKNILPKEGGARKIIPRRKKPKNNRSLQIRHNYKKKVIAHIIKTFFENYDAF